MAVVDLALRELGDASWSCPTPFTPTNIHTLGPSGAWCSVAVGAASSSRRRAPSRSSVDQRVGVGRPAPPWPASRTLVERPRRWSACRRRRGAAPPRARPMSRRRSFAARRARRATGERGAGLAEPVAQRGGLARATTSALGSARLGSRRRGRFLEPAARRDRPSAEPDELGGEPEMPMTEHGGEGRTTRQVASVGERIRARRSLPVALGAARPGRRRRPAAADRRGGT